MLEVHGYSIVDCLSTVARAEVASNTARHALPLQGRKLREADHVPRPAVPDVPEVQMCMQSPSMRNIH